MSIQQQLKEATGNGDVAWTSLTISSQKASNDFVGSAEREKKIDLFFFISCVPNNHQFLAYSFWINFWSMVIMNAILSLLFLLPLLLLNGICPPPLLFWGWNFFPGHRYPGSIHHSLNLTSVYNHFLPERGCQEITTMPMGVGATVDYIFYSAMPIKNDQEECE